MVLAKHIALCRGCNTSDDIAADDAGGKEVLEFD